MLFVRSSRNGFCAPARCDRLLFWKTSSALDLYFCAFKHCVKSAEAFSLSEVEKSGKMWQTPVFCLRLCVSELSVVGCSEISGRKCTPAIASHLHLVWITAPVVEREENHLGNLRLPSAKNTANVPKCRIRAGLTRTQLYCVSKAETAAKWKLCISIECFL